MLQRRLGAAPRRALHSVFAAAAAHPRRVALAWRRPDDALHGPLRNVRYDELLSMAADAAARVRQTTAAAAARKGEPPRVAVFGPPSPDLVAAMWGVWSERGTVVPLSHSASPAEIAHALSDSQSHAVFCALEAPEPLLAEARRLGVAVVPPAPLSPAASFAKPPQLADDDGAFIVYTSGTTGKPKGVLTTQAALSAQAGMLVEAWGWQPSDRVLLSLPLHHVHGLVNVVQCALVSGATCEIGGRFDAERVWSALTRHAETPERLSLYMAVPTVYAKLLEHFDKQDVATQQQLSTSIKCSGLRLMVSGSSTLPVPVFNRWREATGHTLLERYGMTEFGMALSNPLSGERIAGSVGFPLPGVEAREGRDGELLIRSPGMFSAYWNRPDATRAAFENPEAPPPQRWFRTGDVAEQASGRWVIRGRLTADIIKSSGYKLSALEIENVILEDADVAECAVLGVPDAVAGERVAALIAPRSGLSLAEAQARFAAPALRAALASRLSPYKIPTLVRIVDSIPRNAMGKVNKRALVTLFVDDAKTKAERK